MGKNPAFGRAPWNKGRTKATDQTVAAYAKKLKTSCLGRVPHNKGRTKLDYEPLREVSEKCAGHLNGMAGKKPWNVGLRKLTNPEITYGVSRESTGTGVAEPEDFGDTTGRWLALRLYAETAIPVVSVVGRRVSWSPHSSIQGLPRQPSFQPDHAL